jgi:hypothetical protein
MTTLRSGRDAELLALEDPAEYERLLAGYWRLVGSRSDVANAAEAIDAADHGAQIVTLKVDAGDPEFVKAFSSAYQEVREERSRRDGGRGRLDRIAAALLAVARLRRSSGIAA